MKQSKVTALLSSLLLGLGLITFIPHVDRAEAASGVSCSGTTCTATFEYTGAVQTFTPSSVGQQLTITVSGAAGGKGGSDNGGPGGAGSNGAVFTFNYTATSTNPIYLYVGSAGTGAGGCDRGNGAAGGISVWSGQYAGGKGGGAVDAE